MKELLPGPCSLHVRRGDRSRCLACKSHGLSLGEVSAVCLGLLECLSAWAPNASVSGAFGRGGAGGWGLLMSCVSLRRGVCVCVCRGKWYLLGLLEDVKDRGEQSSLLSEELERSIQTFRTA